ncbi:MAG: acyloxyacyl hydrolase [Phycisphaerales bacterium]
MMTQLIVQTALSLAPVSAVHDAAAWATTSDSSTTRLATPPIALVQPESVPPAPSSDSQPDARSAATDAGAASASIPFGRAGSNSLVLGFGYLNDFDDIQAGEVHAGYSHFLCDSLEFSVELTAWYVDQDDDTGAINPGFQFRWHFLHADDYAWTIYGEAGIGLLFAFDNVPDDGTGFNFSPRAGAGATFRLSDDLRLQLGVRWQHFSNGRIEGNDRNPGLDGLMAYVGFVIPLN